MILVAHPTGNAFVRQALAAFLDQGQLVEFATTIATNRAAFYNRILPASLRAELRRRDYDPIPRHLIHCSPALEILRLAAPRLGLTRYVRHERGFASVDAVYRALDCSVAKRLPALARPKNVRAVYAYEDGAEQTFEAAARLGLRRVYDLPIAYWRYGKALMREEAERLPEWAPTLAGNYDSESKVERKDHELELADVVIVASSFTRDSLGCAPNPIRAPVRLVPYGASGLLSRQELDRRLLDRRRGALRVLFVGGLSQRKGLAEVFEVARRMGPMIALTVVGRGGHDCRPLREGLAACRYIPSMPHAELLQEMSRHDVLLFPSLFEGFGLVILEAMAQGVPVITTTHTAGPDVIDNGVDGVIVPIRAVEAIVEKLIEFVQRPEILSSMSELAWLKAQRLTWEAYRDTLVRTLFP